ncbi:MAG TPA: nucleotidyltransferase family protein [Myxococcaceae bacterium]|nr:nucleotidyltransferase family protein [Myxococcaceae bacterium]
MQCLILAGGLGTRIASVAPTIPKTLIPVAGAPFAQHQLTLLARSGIDRVVYSIAHRGEQVEEFVGDGSRWGLEVAYVHDGEKLLGTGGAVRAALDAGVLENSFFVLYGDSYLPIDYRSVQAAFQKSGSPALMTVFRNAGRWDTSNVLYEGGRVLLYDKRRADPRSSAMVHIDYGLSVLTSDVVAERIPPAQPSDLADLFHTLSVGGELAGYEVTTRFYEVGSPAGLKDLEALLSTRPSGA